MAGNLTGDIGDEEYYLYDVVTEKELDINRTEHLKTHRGPDTAEDEICTIDIL